MNGLLQVNKKRVRVTLRIGTEKIDLMVSQGNVSSYLAAEERLNKLFNKYKAKLPRSPLKHIYALTALACALGEGGNTETEK